MKKESRGGLAKRSALKNLCENNNSMNEAKTNAAASIKRPIIAKAIPPIQTFIISDTESDSDIEIVQWTRSTDVKPVIKFEYKMDSE